MRSIPILLQDHLNEVSTTLTNLVKIKLTNGRVIGITPHNEDVTYNDGGGDLIYRAALNPRSFKQNANLEVNTSESMILTDVTDVLTAAEIRAGILDSGKYWVYRVNWADVGIGHALIDYGTTGIAKTVDGLSGVIELRGIAQGLKQTFVEQYSLSCRADFASQAGLTRFPCNFNGDSITTTGTVDSVDPNEPDRLFSATFSPVTGPNGNIPFAPGVLQFQSGDNNLLYVEIEAVSGSAIELQFGVPYDIQAGDTFRMRPDCAKRFKEDCIDVYDNALNFRGEPLIPMGEEGPAGAPGANIPAFGSGLFSSIR